MRGLPSGYTEMLAIQGDGATLISTGVTWVTHPRIVIDVMSPGGVFFGNYHASSRRLYGNVAGSWFYGSKVHDTAESSYANQRVTVSFSDTTLSINGTAIKTYTATSQVGTSTGYLRLFGQSGAGGTNYAQSGTRIYSVQIYKTVDSVEALVFDGVPCARDYDGAAGFYDLISNTFKGADEGEPVAVPFSAPMTIEDFWLDGLTANSASSYGIKFQKEIEFEGAEPNVEAVSVPGRNGDILLLDGTYKNVKGTATCYCLSSNVAASITAVNQWLLADTGYRRLETLHEPEYYRMARVTKGAKLLPRLNKINAFEIELDCMPQKFLKSGETAILVNSGDTITNPTRFLAKPLIVFTVTANDGFANISFDGSNFFTIDISGITPGYTVEIDVEERTVRVNGTLDYDHKSSGAFDWFFLGTSTTITYSGYISNVTLTPRWWTI